MLGAAHKDELLVSLHKIFVPETEDVFRQELVAIAEGRTFFEAETALRTLKGDRLSVLLTIAFPSEADALDCVLVSMMDITERERMNEALHQAQAELAHVTRVTTLGQLTASIAHEVNQPLAAIVTNGEACLRWLGYDPPQLDEVRGAVESMIGDGMRASEVVSGLRALSKKTDPQRMRLNLNDVVREVIPLVHREVFNHRVSLRLGARARAAPRARRPDSAAAGRHEPADQWNPSHGLRHRPHARSCRSGRASSTTTRC